MPNLDFGALLPKHHTFTDADGTRHEFIARADFGAVQMARFKKATNALTASMEALAKDETDEDAAVALETAVNDALAVLLPSLPRARLAEMTLGMKNSIVNFWNAQEAETPAGEALAGQSAAS